jgi:glycosyltransferase involved in cell wall biosynthesis
MGALSGRGIGCLGGILLMSRLAIVTSHPIQYHSPWFRALAGVTDLKVFYCHRQDAAGQAEAGFGVEFEWDVPLLDGYRYSFLENRAASPSVFTFAGCDTPEIGERLAEGRFDACLITGWYLKSYLQALIACQRLGIPAFARGDSQLATERSRMWTAAKYLPYRLLLGRFAAHLVVGENNRRYLRHYGVSDDRMFFTPHFVDNDFFSRQASVARADGSRERLRRALGVAPNAMLFVFVGKLIEKKRPMDFIRALANAQGALSHVHGLIVGSGSLEPELKALAGAANAPVTFAGFQNQRALPSYLAAADALVLPSDAGETWGLVVNEAMACGLPAVVSSAAGCAADLIDEGRTGYTFPVGDVERLGAAMLALARDIASDRAAIERTLAAKMSRYSCASAVQGAIAALQSVTRPVAVSA